MFVCLFDNEHHNCLIGLTLLTSMHLLCGNAFYSLRHPTTIIFSTAVIFCSLVHMRFDKFEVKIGRFLGFFVKSVKNKLTGSGRYSVETSSLGSFDPYKKCR